jgi:hypothetical protein
MIRPTQEASEVNSGVRIQEKEYRIMKSISRRQVLDSGCRAKRTEKTDDPNPATSRKRATTWWIPDYCKPI